MGEITIENKPAQFHKLTRKVSRYVTEGKTPVYGLENAYGYGRTLAVWLLEKGCIVKDVNTALSYAQRKSVPMYQKSDSYDAEAVALVLINKLPDAIPDDKYWTLSQLVNRRDNISVHQQRLKNQLHEQLCMAYPSYKKFFEDIGRPTPLYFFGRYPSPIHLHGKSAEELAGELRPVSHNNCSTKRADRTLELVKSRRGNLPRLPGEPGCRHQRPGGGFGALYRVQMKEVEAAIEAMLPNFNCTLMTMPGIDIATAANLLSEIGNIDRFPNANKLAKFAGIAPVNFSSAGKGKDVCPKQGNRRLQAIFYFLAIQMVQVASSGTARHLVFLEYYLRKQEEGKNKPQALICIARRLVNIVYGMLKNHTEFREPERRTGEETV